MGLDSVELLVEIENYFNLEISDEQAKKILTVQNMVDVIAEHLSINSNDKQLQKDVFLIFSNKINERKGTTKIELGDKISAYLQPEEPISFIDFSNTIKLETPRISNDNKNNILNKLRNFITWKPNYDWRKLTIENFIDSICIKNYDKLIEPEFIKSKYEIYICVAGITVEKIGVDCLEIRLEKSFCDDFGID